MKLVEVLILSVFTAALSPAAERDVLVRTNTTIRIMASNMNGNAQKIEPFEIRIFQGLKPDIVAIQEFNYSNNTAANFRELLDTAFGTNFVYFRESGYSIPNGIISRYPFVAAGSWSDTNLTDRGFAWARIDVPGPDDLFVVSVHLKASGSSSDVTKRSQQALELKTMINSNFPTNAWIIVAGDFNLQTRSTSSEPALATFKTFLSDDAIPTDAESGGNPNTNEPRSKPYDFVLPSYTLQTNLVPLVIGSRSFQNGLVFDSRVFTPLLAVAPVQLADSGNGQHMAVMKDFRISHFLTNRIQVPEPVLTFNRSNILGWNSVAGANYALEVSTNLSTWTTAMVVTATGTNLSVSNSAGIDHARFYRVRF